VLGFLVLLSGLMLAFFSSVQTDLQGSKAYAGGVTVKQLAETTTNVVIGQLNDATKSHLVPGDTSSTRLTWASQPGLVHTYGDDGKPGRSFKLYSSANMVEDAGTDYLPANQLNTEVPDTWPSATALFSDLNSPVLVPDAVGKVSVDGKKYTANYPILDPLGQYDQSTQTGIEGFTIQNARGFGLATWTPNETYNPTVSTNPAKTGNPAPMPTRWLYVLRDGTITAPDSGGTTTATWSSAPSNLKPSQDNPIVGRVAFWTDDESSKLNINTASEGVFWDRPWANSSVPSSPFGEKELAQCIPAQNEFQRFAGHPAMTCLSPVLRIVSTAYKPPTGMMWDSGSYSIFQNYYKLVPRAASGGTEAGTKNSTGDASAFAVTLGSDRLYSSVDELLFSATPSGSLRQPNTQITRSVLEKTKFFLTANSRAPEVNLFGRPRITLWPLQQDSEPNAGKPDGTSGGGPSTCPKVPRNSKDVLIAFCSSIGKDPTDTSGVRMLPYYFQRYSIYLRDSVNNRGAGGRPTGTNGLPIPFMQVPDKGFEPPSSQLPGVDWVGTNTSPPDSLIAVKRNQTLYTYLQDLTSKAVPGFGSKFTTKYSASAGGVTERDQILTQMVDFARSGANTYSTGLKNPRYEFAPARDMPDASIGETQVVPLIPPAGPGFGTKGFGRFSTITEAALLFYRVKHTAVGGPSSTVPQDKIRCLLIFETASPTCGPASWSPLARYVVKGLEKVKINSETDLFAKGPLQNLVTSRVGYGSGSDHSTAFNGLYASFRRWKGSGSDEDKHILNIDEIAPGKFDEEIDYPFVSKGVNIKAGDTQFTFDLSGEIEVEVHSGFETTVSSASLVQTLKFKFPPGKWNVPADTGLEEKSVGKVGINNRGVGNLVNTNSDVVRSVELDYRGETKGDIRLLAGRSVVEPANFVPFDQSQYDDPSRKMAHSLRMGSSARWGGSLSGTLVSGLTFDRSPVAARGLAGANLANGSAGDWDNGNGSLEDGAYINKPDEGNSRDGEGAYFSTGSFSTETGASFSPNRQVSSAVMFGSLPSGVVGRKPWQTLLFCKNPAAGSQHPGFSLPRDHLLLDLFTMPIVEPYAISEPFSTAGKVNLNYQIAPFTYITRSTALRGVMKSTMLTAIPTSSTNYKSGAGATLFRKEIDMDETLLGFEQRFKTDSGNTYSAEKGMFRSASEICDMYLVPKGAKLANMSNWWNDYRYTGDNARENPYGHIYPRVTTKSNVFTVHMRVQVLRKRTTTDSAKWEEGTDAVLSEHRGSTVIERYIDPGDPNLPDFAAKPAVSMDDYYKFRIVSTKKFAP